MIPSIRLSLLINLLLCITLINSLAIIGDIFFERKTLYQHLDSDLVTTAYLLQATLSVSHQPLQLAKIQKHINKLPGLLHDIYCISKHNDCNRVIDYVLNKTKFTVLNQAQKVVLHSHNPIMLPIEKLSKKTGFYDKNINGISWRIFARYNRANQLSIIVAEPYEVRHRLETKLTQHSIWLMLLTYPFLGLIIWLIIGRNFDSVTKIANEVKNRAASRLQPVDIKSVPREIEPLVRELNELFERLREGFQREKRFAADAAHELKTPLAALRTQAQIALSTAQDEERIAALNKVIEGVDRSTHVVLQLLTLSRMVPDTVINQGGHVPVIKEAREVIANLVPTARKKKIEIELVAPEQEQFIFGNATAINILLRNLIDNAIRYTPVDGFVQVVVEAKPKYVIIRVIDNGPGIPKNLRKRVFERFYRVLGTKASGSGLGLGIVQQIVKIHKGKIKLTTPKSGKGLEVVVVFNSMQP